MNAPKYLLLPASNKAEMARRAAADLINLAATGQLSVGAIRELGSAVVERDLASPDWQLKNWKKPRLLGRATGIIAMDLALADAFKPQRLRLGERWVKAEDERVDDECVPATDLTDDQLRQALRLLFFRQLKEQAEFLADPGSIEAKQATRHPEVDLLLVGEFSKRPAIHPYAPEPFRGPAPLPIEMEPEPVTPREFLEQLSRQHLDASEREVLRLKIADESEAQIATRLGCSDRKVRRIWRRVKEKAREFKPGACAPLLKAPTAANEPLVADSKEAA